jgi:hydroxymethylbilane synthase
LPTTLPIGLKLGGVTFRETPNDVLISNKYSSIEELPARARVATGSLRRRSQLLAYRNDLEILEIRGNVPTRIRKFESSDLDAMILAFAGVSRLGLDAYIKQTIPFEIMLPAVGQGVIGIEIREGDVQTEELLKPIIDQETETCILAERSFLRSLEGGCQVPIAGHAHLNGDEISLEGFVGSLDGGTTIRESITGKSTDPVVLGQQLADRMTGKGANGLLSSARNAAQSTIETVI